MNKEGKQRQVILDAAYSCISFKGYANSSMRDIAKEAEVTLSQLHYYFGSKQDLFKEVIVEMKTKYINAFKIAQENAKLEKKPAISAIVDFEKSLIVNNSELLQLLIDLSSLALHYEDFKVLMTSFFDELIELIEKSLEGNAFKIKMLEESNKNIVSKVLIGSLLGIAFQYILNPTDKYDDFESLGLLGELLS